MNERRMKSSAFSAHQRPLLMWANGQKNHTLSTIF